MTKKEYIITFLDKVKDIWEPARGFAVLMRYDIFNDQQRKRKLQLAIDNIEAIKRKEKKSESIHFERDLDAILTEA